MPKNISRAPSVQSPQELLEDILSPQLLPDESADSYEALRAALFADLAPVTASEHLLADQLVALEWETLRHRRLFASLLTAEFRRQAVDVFEPRSGSLISSDFRSGGAKELARALVSQDGGRRETALAALAEREITAEEIMAKAYQALARDLEPHERHIAESEVRRRRLREDYDRLKAANARRIQDAEDVDE